MNTFPKKIFRAETILGVTTPINLSERFHGIAPFSYSIKKYFSEAKFSKPWLTFNIIFFLFYVYSLLITTFDKDSNSNFKHFLQTKLSGFLILLFIPLTFFYRNKHAEIIEHLLEVDASIKCLSINLDYTRLKKKVLLIMSVYYCYQFISFVIYFVSKLDQPNMASFYFFTSFMTPILAFSLCVTIFSLYVYISCNYFVVINNEILKLITNASESKNHYVKSISATVPKYVTSKNKFMNRENNEKILKIWKAYGDISNLCNAIDEAWSCKLLIIFAGTFISTIFNMNFILNQILTMIMGDGISYDDSIFSLVILHQIISQFLVVMIPSISCNNCHEQVNIYLFISYKISCFKKNMIYI